MKAYLLRRSSSEFSPQLKFFLLPSIQFFTFFMASALLSVLWQLYQVHQVELVWPLLSCSMVCLFLFSSLAKFSYLSFFSPFLSAEKVKSSIRQVLSWFFFFGGGGCFFFFTITGSGSLAEIKWFVCISNFQRILCVSFSRMDSGLHLYHWLRWSNFSFLHNSPLDHLSHPVVFSLVLFIIIIFLLIIIICCWCRSSSLCLSISLFVSLIFGSLYSSSSSSSSSSSAAAAAAALHHFFRLKRLILALIFFSPCLLSQVPRTSTAISITVTFICHRLYNSLIRLTYLPSILILLLLLLLLPLLLLDFIIIISLFYFLESFSH